MNTIAPILIPLFASDWSKLLRSMLERYSIDMVNRVGKDASLLTEVVRGRLTIGFASDWTFADKLPFMVCHELGHAAAATRTEFYQPNLGLPIPEDESSTITSRITEVELEALAFQAALIESFGGNPVRDRMLQLCKPLFKIKPSELQAAYDSPDYSVEAWAARFNRNASPQIQTQLVG